MQNTERKIDREDRFRHSRYLVAALLPFLKLLRQEQVMEKEVEANIQGRNFYFLSLSSSPFGDGWGLVLTRYFI